MFKAKSKFWTCVALMALAPCLAADDIYRWVDEDGVVHFSDKPPAASPAEVRTVEVDAARPSDYDDQADPFNIEATAARTRAHRERLAEQRVAQPPAPVQSAAQSGNQVVTYGQPYGYPVYPRPPRPQPPPRPPPPVEPPGDGTSTLRPPGRSNQ